MTSNGVITIAAVGDVILQGRPDPSGIERVRALLAGADIAIANVDTVLSQAGQPAPKWANLRGPREATHDLRAMGFDVVSLANNHAMDFRAEGMLDMQAALREAGIAPVGAGANLSEATAPVLFERGGRTVAILALATTIPPGSAAGPASPGIAPVTVHQAYELDPTLAMEQPGTVPVVTGRLDEAELARALADVAAARARADIVIVLPHWGVPSPWRAPMHPTIQEHQRILGRSLIDAGADAVIGNHAHELHEIEMYRGKPIAYCLGNFWVDGIGAWPWLRRETIVVRFQFTATGASDIEIASVLLDDEGRPHPDPDELALSLFEHFLTTARDVTVTDSSRFSVRRSRT